VSYALALLPIVLLVGRMRVHRWVELAALLLVLIATMPFHGARPHLLALAIFNTLLVLLEPPFGMVNALLVGGGLGVWAHMHASFLYGFALLGGAAIAWSLARDVRSVMGTVLALVVGVALSLLTPLGLQTWIYPLTAVATPFNLMYNHDWQSLRPLSASGAAMGLLMLVSVLLGVSRKPSARAVGAVLLLLPAIQYVRLTLFAAPLLMVAALERLIERAPHLRLRPGTRPFELAAAPVVSLVSWALLFIGLVGMAPLLPVSIEASSLGPVPTTAVDRLLACGEPAPLWNDYNWGAYLTWRGRGRYLVSIDGRDETLYSPEVLDRYVQYIQGREGWQDLVQGSPAQYAVLPARGFPSMVGLAGWHQVYADALAAVSARDGAPWHCASGPF